MRRMTAKLARVMLCTLLCAVTVTTAGSRAAAQAPCSRWDLNGEWRFIQTNMSFDLAPVFTLAVTENGIEGSAYYMYIEEGILFVRGARRYRVNGSVDGTINGDSVELTVYWQKHSTGVYKGRITPRGRIEGTAYDKQHPEIKADWYSERRARCLARGAPAIGTTKSALISSVEPEPGAVKSGPRARGSAQQQPSTLSTCQSAEIARARNSPAAPGLTAQCFAIVNDLATKGVAIANQDPEAVALRSQQPDDLTRRGFDIGMAASEGQTLPGPGKDAIRDSLPAAERRGFIAAVSFSLTRNRQKLTDLAPRGAELAQEDPLATELRNQQPDDAARLGFDIGMAAAEKQTADGPGKQRIHDSLAAEEKKGFAVAVAFSLERNRNAERAATGAKIISVDAAARTARNADANVFYRLGFDIATAIFGDPTLGAQGNTSTGPGSLGVRDSLSAAGQRGFNAAVQFHLSKNYQAMIERDRVDANEAATSTGPGSLGIRDSLSPDGQRGFNAAVTFHLSRKYTN